MARRMGLTLIAIVLGTIAAIGAAFGTAAAVGAITGHKAPAANGGRPTPPPTTITFTESEYSIVTPAGWIRKDVTANADARKAIRYSYADGSYFTVAMDPLGSDFAPDTVWTYRVAGTRFEVVSKQACTTGDELCPDKDGRYDGYIMWKSGTNPQKVAGHVYYFMFGNSEKATVDASDFEQILGSITVNA